MTFTDQGKIVRFIKDAKEHRQWLFDEFSDLDARSDDYESNQRAIRGAIGELDKIIGNAIQMRGIVVSCRTAVTTDGILAPQVNPSATGEVGDFPGEAEGKVLEIVRIRFRRQLRRAILASLSAA